MVILVVREFEDEVETVIGLCEYRVDRASSYGEVAFAVRDDHHGMGIGGFFLEKRFRKGTYVLHMTFKR